MTITKTSLTLPLGQLVITRGVLDAMADTKDFSEYVLSSLQRHASGDYGEMDAHDMGANAYAWSHGLRVLSSYTDAKGRFPQHGVATIWIITEADRASTTILFPDEY